MAHPNPRSPPLPNSDSFQQRIIQKINVFKIAELRAVLRCAGGSTSGNKSRVLSLVKHLVSQSDKQAIEKINLIYNSTYGDRVRVPTSSIQDRRYSNSSIPNRPPTQSADRPSTTPGFQLRQQFHPQVFPNDTSRYMHVHDVSWYVVIYYSVDLLNLLTKSNFLSYSVRKSRPLSEIS